ncbi:DUF262 domain-containing protein [Pseudonocardia saturnea]
MPQDQEQRLPKIVGERMLEIADYQRPYAWERKQLIDLWEDLDLLGPQGTHYAGTLVLRNVMDGGAPREVQSDDGSVLQVCEVVDGQQRLTTCFILLDRVRRSLERLDRHGFSGAGPIARRIRETFGVVRIGGASRTRLSLGAGLQQYWSETVLGDEVYVGPALVAGQERLRDAVSFFDKKVEELAAGVSDEVFLGRLKDLQSRVTSRLGFLVYEVKSHAEVGVIFETLNERGRPFTDLEKSKNYLLYLARSIPDGRGEALAEEINSSWAAIFGNLAGHARGQDDQLLRAHWLATQDPDLRSWKRIVSLKTRFDRSNYISEATRLVPAERPPEDQARAWNRLYDDVRGYVRTLRHCSYFLAEMFDPHAAFAEFDNQRDAVIQWSGALQRSGVVSIYRPLLFAARLAHANDGQFYCRLVQACERYSARVFVIERRRANAGEPRLARLANDLIEGTDPEEILAQLDAVHWRYAPDARVAATLHNVAENWYVRRGHKYFLYEYERSMPGAASELAEFSAFMSDSNHEQRTTEHILPQNPSDDATCWWSRFSAEQHAELKHSLGNLVLTYDNSSYSNKCFRLKRGDHQRPGEAPRTCYVQARLHQERELARYVEWTPETVHERQAALAEWALTRWSVEYQPSHPVDEPELEPEGSVEDAALLDELDDDET